MSKTPKPYSEDNPDHVPNPLYQSGVVDTTGTFGDGSSIESISPVFAQARANVLGGAVDALDDPDRDESDVVVFPESDKTRETAEQELRDAANEAANAPGVGEVVAPGSNVPDADASAGATPAKAPAKKAPAKTPAKKAPASKATAK